MTNNQRAIIRTIKACTAKLEADTGHRITNVVYVPATNEAEASATSNN